MRPDTLPARPEHRMTPPVPLQRRRILIVAAHVPPYRVGSGYLRVTKFCEQLPMHGWDPIVLAPRLSAFPQESIDPDPGAAPDYPVVRTFALDTARHLAVRGRYPGPLAVPDRWVSWLPSAFAAGLRMVRRERPDVLLSTYPIATAHLVGLALQRATGLPWIADFRDPMIDTHYPPPGIARRAREALERQTIHRCAGALFTTPSTRELYQQRYPDAASAGKLRLIMNGYDEDDFAQAQAIQGARPKADGPAVLLHSGVLYRDVRDPTSLFRAIQSLRAEGVVSAQVLRVVLRACGPEEHYRRVVAEHGIADIVSILPAVPYTSALAEMMSVDGLLLMQGPAANRQVPAKLFEYLRAGRPILALIDKAGDTARVLGEAGSGKLVPIDSIDEIKAALREFVNDPERRRCWAAPLESAQRYSRHGSTRALAEVLSDIVGRSAAAQSSAESR